MSTGEDFKSSAHVWGGDQQDDNRNDDLPPAYSGIAPETNIQPPELPARPRRKITPRETYHPIRAIAKWAKVPWGMYIVPDGVLSADRTTITTTHPTFMTNQQALMKLLTDQAQVPPIPILRITGKHHKNGTNYSPQIDFDFTINLGNLLDLSRTARWHNKPAQVVPLQGPSGTAPASFQVSGNNIAQLETVARQFLRDKSDRKSFFLRKTVDNLPTDVIEGLVRTLIASLRYRGKVDVTFPIQCGTLILQRKPVGTGAAVGGWFMNALGLSPDVKYDSLQRVWSIGSPRLVTSQTDSDDDTDEDFATGHALVKEWWNTWAPPIRDAILLKRQGKVGVEDWMEAQMGWRPQAMNLDWGVDYA